MRASRKRRSAPSPTTATQPSGRVIAASPAPSRSSSERPWARSPGSANSCPTSSSASRSLGVTTEAPARTPASIALALGVEDDDDVALAQVLDQARVEVVAGAGRQRAGEHAEPRARREVVEPLDEALDLLRADRRAALVDLGLLAGGRVDHRQVDPGLAGDPGEVGQHRLLAQLFEHAGAGRAAGEAGGDHGLAEQAERAGDVDPLAAGDGAALDRAVAAPEPEVRHRDGAVDRGVEGDGEDHFATTPAIYLPDLPRALRRLTARHRKAAPISITNSGDRGENRVVRDEAAHPVEEARLGDRAAGAQRASSRPGGRRRGPWRGRGRAPRSIGPSTSAGASTVEAEPLAAIACRRRRCARPAAAASRRRSGSPGRPCPGRRGSAPACGTGRSRSRAARGSRRRALPRSARRSRPRSARRPCACPSRRGRSRRRRCGRSSPPSPRARGGAVR